MKKLVALPLAALAFAACAESGPTNPTAVRPNLTLDGGSDGNGVAGGDEHGAMKPSGLAAASGATLVTTTTGGTTGGDVVLSWSAPANGGAHQTANTDQVTGQRYAVTMTGYEVRVSCAATTVDGCSTTVTGNGTTQAPHTTTQLNLGKLKAGSYLVRIRGVGTTNERNGKSDNFNTVYHGSRFAEITFAVSEYQAPPPPPPPAKVGQVITITVPATFTGLTYGDGHLDVEPWVSVTTTENPPKTGLDPVFTSLTESVCTLSGTEVVIKAADLCKIEVSQPGDESHQAAASKTIELQIAKATLTATVTSASKTYGEANPTLTGVVTGFVYGESLAGPKFPAGYVAPTYTTTAETASDVGTYPITGAGGSATNYVFQYVAGVLTIDPAVLTVTPDNATAFQGQTVWPTFTGKITGFVLGQGTSVLTAQPEYATNAALPAIIGTYQITASGAAAPNYTFLYNAGTLKVTYALDGGIRQPINPDNTSLFSRGRSVPVKFGMLYDGAPNFANGFSTSGWKVVQVPVSCTSVSATVTETETDALSTSAAGFRYDATSDQYIFNADFSSKAVGSCWRVRVDFNDGSSLSSATFKLQK